MSGGWFLNREDAEAFLATIERNPNFTYTVALSGCAPAWGVMVYDTAGNLISEAYVPGEELEFHHSPSPAEIDKTLDQLMAEGKIVKRGDRYYLAENDPEPS